MIDETFFDALAWYPSNEIDASVKQLLTENFKKHIPVIIQLSLIIRQMYY